MSGPDFSARAARRRRRMTSFRPRVRLVGETHCPKAHLPPPCEARSGQIAPMAVEGSMQDGPPVSLEGQVCRMRALSKRLVFFDFMLTPQSAAGLPAAEAGAGGADTPQQAQPPPGAACGEQPAAPQQQPGVERWVEVIAKHSLWDGVQAARDGIRCAAGARAPQNAERRPRPRPRLRRGAYAPGMTRSACPLPAPPGSATSCGSGARGRTRPRRSSLAAGLRC